MDAPEALRTLPRDDVPPRGFDMVGLVARGRAVHLSTTDPATHLVIRREDRGQRRPRPLPHRR